MLSHIFSELKFLLSVPAEYSKQTEILIDFHWKVKYYIRHKLSIEDSILLAVKDTKILIKYPRIGHLGAIFGRDPSKVRKEYKEIK